MNDVIVVRTDKLASFIGLHTSITHTYTHNKSRDAKASRLNWPWDNNLGLVTSALVSGPSRVWPRPWTLF